MSTIKKFIFVLTIILSIGRINVSTYAATSSPNWNSGNYSTYNPFAKSNLYGQCTWYAWGRARELTGKELPCRGNAYTWYSTMASNGYSVGSTPKENSIAVWQKGAYGHVAYVEGVSGDSVTISESNWDKVTYNNQYSLSAGINYYSGRKTLSTTQMKNRYGTFLGYAYIIKPASNNPQGSLDHVSGGNRTIRVSGWAFDKDNFNTQLDIHVYVGGKAGSGAPRYVIKANTKRDDVPKVFPGCGAYHGYDSTIKVDRYGTQTIYVYAVNIGGGKDTLIGQKTVKISGYDPQGYFDVATGGKGTVYVRGWAFDRDNLNAQLEIHVYVGGNSLSGVPGYKIKANTKRDDVPKVFPGCGAYHGYDSTIKVDRYGTQPVYVYAINVDGGSNVLLGQKTVNISCETTSLSVTPPAKKEYVLGESWNPNGMKVYAHLSDGSKKEVTDYQISGFDTNSLGTKRIVVTYDGKKTSFDITVKRLGGQTSVASGVYMDGLYRVYNGNYPYQAVKDYVESRGGKLISITSEIEQSRVVAIMSKAKTKATYYYTGGYRSNEKDKWKWSTGEAVSYSKWRTGEPNGKGQQAIVIDQTGNWSDVELTKANTGFIAKYPVKSISIVKPNKLQYKVGENLDLTGFKLYAIYSVGAKYSIKTSACKFTGFDSSSVGMKTVTVNFSGKTATFTVQITASENDSQNGNGSQGSSSGLNYKKGQIVTDTDGGSYKVVSNAGGKVTFEYRGVKNKNAKSVTVPWNLICDGVYCKVVSIAPKAFKGMKKLQTVYVGNAVKKIGSEAFSGCTSLKNVVFGASVTEIGTGAFLKCTKLQSIIIPSKVTKIGAKAFYGCKNLKKITVKTARLKSVGANALKGIHKKAVIKVPKKQYKKYTKLFKNKGQKKTVKIKK